METISDLSGQPIVVVLAGVSHKFRQLTLAELFGKFEAEVKNDWTARVHEIAAGLPDSDRIAYLSHEAAHPLSVENASNLVKEKMNSALGISLILAAAHIAEGKDDIIPPVIELMSVPADQLAVRGLVEVVTSTKGVKVEDGKDGPKA